MKTSLLKGSVTYAAATIVSRIAVIIIIPILTRIMSVDEYGAMNIMTTMVQLANFIITLEIAQAVTLYYTNQFDSNRRYYPSTALWFIAGIYFILIAIAALMWGLGLWTNISVSLFSSQLIFAGIFLLASNGLFQLLQNQLRLEFKSTAYGTLTVFYVILSSVGAVLGAKYFPHAAVGVIGGQAMGTTIAALSALIYLKQKFSFGFKKEALKKMLTYSLPLVPASFFLIGAQQAPKLALGLYGTLEQAGIFGLAMQIGGFAGLALIGVQTAITPAVLANHALPETPKKIGGLFEIFFILSLLFCAALSVFSKELIMIFSTDAYLDSSYYVPVLAFGIAFNGLYIFFPGKIINGRSSAQLLASAISFIVSILAAFILIKIDGIRGAAVSTLLSSATFFFCWYIISQKLYYVPVNWFRVMVKGLFIITVSVTVFYFVPSDIKFSVILIKSVILIALTIIVGYGYLSNGIKTYLAHPKT